MRPFLDVLRFELRFQCGAPLFAGVLLLFFLIHLLTIGEAGINISDNDLIVVNAPSQIFQTELVLGVFGVLPAIAFVVNAMVRDYDRQTVELFFTTPVGARPWLFGRFVGGTLCALFAGLAGLLGTLAGTFMPWIDPARVAPFDLVPYLASVSVLVLPNLLVFCAISGGVAALSRSQAWTFSVALCLVVGEIVLVNLDAQGGTAWWLAWIEPMGGLAITGTMRYWTVAELNSQMPVAPVLIANRAVWLGVGLAVLCVTLGRLRLELPRPSAVSPASRRPSAAAPDAAAVSPVARASGVGLREALAPLASQLRMDLRAVVPTRLFALVLALTVVATASEIGGNRDALGGLPLHPMTGLMLGFFRYGLIQFALMIVVYYSATLVFREREHGLAEIVGAAPHQDWVMAASKTLTLCLAITLMLLASMATSVAWQLLAGHYELEPGVYLQGLFIYSGAYFYMLCVLAIVVQACSPGKWSGMVALLMVFVALFAMEAFGLEHVLYGFRIPFVVYSDMNGFGHFTAPTLTLIGYWGLFCVLLLAAGHLAYPRGTVSGVAARLRDAGDRITPRIVLVSGVAATLFAAVGGWIYWNTNVLNPYETAASRVAARAAYERTYGTWKNRPTPGFSDIHVEVDLYPGERRLESRGTATLVNRQDTPITDLLVTIDPRLRIERLSLAGAVATVEDAALGVRLLRLPQPLAPQATIQMEWTATRTNRGFVNSGGDHDIVANGTYVTLASIAPWPAYDEDRELTDPGERRRSGLPAAARLPALGDPAWLATLGSGVDGRTDFRAIVSTSADQTAVAPGALQRQWQQNGRRYFEYRLERPTWPAMGFVSARYAIARRTWNDVSIEVYHDAKHPWNVPAMLDTARQSLDYFSREYAPYPLRSFRILEYPRYRSAAQALAGIVAYSETAGFLTDLRGWASLDYATVHELAHQWWGGFAYGAKMQGRQMLNETMAQYSTLMIFKQQPDPRWLRRILAITHRNYLDARSRETVAEQPLMYTEDQGNISYNKGALVMFALQELIGTDRMHQGLRSYLQKFGFKGAPYPTSRDLVNELRAVAGDEYQQIITDFFERIVLYDVSVTAADVKPVDGGHEVAIEIAARQFEADGQGAEREVPLDAWFDVVVFPDAGSDVAVQTPLYQEKVRLRSGRQTQVVRVSAKPGAVAVDPFHLMIDRAPDDNVLVVPRH